LDFRCHPEEAESRAKRAIPDEEPALSEAEGTYATRLQLLERGCPTFRGFRKVGTTGPELSLDPSTQPRGFHARTEVQLWEVA